MKRTSKGKKTATKTAKGKTTAGMAKVGKPSPRNGVSLPVGAHPGNTGGKKGRSGRRPDAFRELLATIRDEKGVPLLLEVLNGEVKYTLRGTCEHCGKKSSGPSAAQIAKLIPSPDARLRAFETLCKHTLPAEKVIRFDGLRDARLVFDTIKERIHARLGADAAAVLIDDINQTLARARQ